MKNLFLSLLAFVVLMSCEKEQITPLDTQTNTALEFRSEQLQTLLTCSGSPTGAKVSYVTPDPASPPPAGEITLRIDWDEGSTFNPVNLAIENGTCETCPRIGGLGNPRPYGTFQYWTIAQTDLNQPVTVAWATTGTINYCGGSTPATVPGTERNEQLETLLTCSGSPTGAKVSLVTLDAPSPAGEITLRIDWDEGSTFNPVNLAIENGTCETCPRIGGLGNPRPYGTFQYWTIAQTDLNQPVTVAWATTGTINYCGGSTPVTIPGTEPSCATDITGIDLPVDPVPFGASVTLAASFDDAGEQAGHSAEIAWGDGAVSSATVDQIANTISATHDYNAPGVYSVTLTLTDACGNQDGETSSSYVVIYDPSAGFVTGGGWIQSPAGAYADDPSLEGKANFGFNAKYKKGQSVPDGKTTFLFKAADFKFQSTDYDWLTIAGPNAKFKGTGQVNGSGNYGFMLTAVDGDVNGGGGADKFRIKIWDKNDGDRVVYDNKMGADDTGYETTVLSGGSITIHK